ncbi:hypothetical protein AB0K05_24800 [Nonomuraea sp. NPDC049486]|uniref:hypothetical protein n=1 Tax=Nonomuraea sp. NPDC049486 TaxID=3155773 RepID=UPI0034178B6F
MTFVYADPDVIRQRQTAAATVLVKLLAEQLPQAAWGITDVLDPSNPGEIDGQISEDSDDAAVTAVKAWARRLGAAPEWKTDTILEVAAPVDGITVIVWTLISQKPSSPAPVAVSS